VPNCAADHIEATRLALAQLPRQLRRRVLIRTDYGGGTQGFLAGLASLGRRLPYSVGFTITDDIQDTILKLPPEIAQLIARHSARWQELGFGSQSEFVDYFSEILRGNSGALRESLANDRTAWFDAGRRTIVIYNWAVDVKSTAFFGDFNEFVRLK